MKKLKKFLLGNIKTVIAFVLGVVISGGTVYAATILFASNEVSYDNTTSGLTSTNVQDALDELYVKVKKKIIYSAGDKVVYGNEEFYILNDVYEGQQTTDILTKLVLEDSASPTKQLNHATDATSLSNYPFASTRYWDDTYTYKNLNTVIGYVEGDAIARAKEYAKNKDAIDGRLLTYEEANNTPKIFNQERYDEFAEFIERGYMTEEEAREEAITPDPNSKITKMIFGLDENEIYNPQHIQSYWLATTMYDANFLYEVGLPINTNNLNGHISIGNSAGISSRYYWVRPVLTVLVSDIHAVS